MHCEENSNRGKMVIFLLRGGLEVRHTQCDVFLISIIKEIILFSKINAKMLRHEFQIYN